MAKETKRGRAVAKKKPTNKCGHSTKSRARPRVELCEEQVAKLASLGTPVEEIANFFNVAKSTLYKNYSDALKAGGQEVRNELRQAQLHVALKDLDCKMLIWLGKQYCGQRDKIDNEVTHHGDISAILQD